MELVSTEEMRLLEQRASKEYGLGPRTLMESAGISAFALVRDVLGGTVSGRRVLVCAGKGNNGGDALVLARYLVNSGAIVYIALATYKEALQGTAAEALTAVAEMICDDEARKATEGRTIWLYECTNLEWKRHLSELPPVDLVVDGLLGTGLSSPLSGVYKEMVAVINSLDCPCVALDIPTGINADNGQIGEVCVEADYTITFGRPKIGLFCYPAPDYVGELSVSTIGMPDTLVKSANLAHVWVQRQGAGAMLPKRPSASHKGSFGHVLTIGGSLGLTGAPCLAALASLRCGAGKSTLAGPAGLHGIFAAKLTEVMTVPVPETETHSIGAGACELLHSIGDFEVTLIGPGLSTHRQTAQFLSEFVPGVKGRLVLDADALNIMASDPETFIPLLHGLQQPAVLTPHPGEMARLLGISTQEVQEYRVTVAKEAAVRWGGIVVLKGANTLIATPQGLVYVNTTGHSGMATAGTGDVLAGAIAGFMAQGVSSIEAAVLGAYMHGLAGERAWEAGLNAGLIAGDLIGYLPIVIEECRQYRIGK